MGRFLFYEERSVKDEKEHNGGVFYLSNSLLVWATGIFGLDYGRGPGTLY
jgi:hypothetical protein